MTLLVRIRFLTHNQELVGSRPSARLERRRRRASAKAIAAFIRGH